jgi:hypothetical protein
MWLSMVRWLTCWPLQMHLASSCLLKTRSGSVANFDEQLELQADLEGASLAGAHLDGATWSDDTVWPEEFHPPAPHRDATS